MNGLIAILALLVIVSAQHYPIQCQQSPIENANKVNVENQQLIISGNALGEIGVCSISGSTVVKTVIKVHSAPIIFIERYLHDNTQEYVIVDQSGTVTIWNNDLTQTLATLDLNATALNVAIREDTEITEDNNLAINFKTFIVELSLNERKEVKRLNQNANFLALSYTEHFLIASTTTSKLIFFDESGNARDDDFNVNENIVYLSRHNHQYKFDLYSAVGLTTNNRLVHITQNGINEITAPIYSRGRAKGNLEANYFGYCKDSIKNGRIKLKTYRDVMVVMFNSITLQLRTFQHAIKVMTLPTEVADIACIDQHMYVLYKGGKLELFELWEYRFGELIVAGAGLSLIVLVFAFAGYQVAKRWGKKKEGKQAWVQTDHSSKNIELKEFLLRESH